MTIAAIVYLLCFATALACAVLVLRGYRRSRSPLLLWAGIGFSFLTLNSLLLVADMLVWPGVDLWWLRQAASATAIGVFLYGFLWKGEA